MSRHSHASWGEVFAASPGPGSWRSAFVLALKGMCMGAADTVPGVSGGTIALITGIYEDLLAAVKSVNFRMIASLARLDVKNAVAEVHVRFILALFLGISAAVFTLARIMNYLLNSAPELTWSLFFGLIAASVWVVGKKVEYWNAARAFSMFFGAAAAFYLVNMVPAETPETAGFIFLSGMAAICAMILPGLSGAFILLILGKYEFITGVLKSPFDPASMGVIAVFAAGCIAGLAGFSRVLKYMLDAWQDLTLAFLTGLMLGSMRKIWPWKQVLETKLTGGELRVIREQNVLPGALNADLFFALALMAAGFLAVVVLEKLSEVKS